MHSERIIRLEARAKVNLVLDVGDRRADGFHELATIFQTVDLCDGMIFKEKGDFSILCDEPGIPTDSRNLIWKAAALLKNTAGYPGGFEVELKKRIPNGAGLGGGSSDAAATLWALNALWQTKLSETELENLGARIGSDVPFFLRGGTALGKGRGEVLEPLQAAPILFLVVALPEERIGTPWAYACLDEMSRRTHCSVQPMIEAIEKSDVFSIARSLGNSFEEALFPQLPVLGKLKKQLLSLGAIGAAMSGSGSALFGIFEEGKDSEAAAIALREEGYFAVAITTAKRGFEQISLR